ncbi:hypothetical protein [Nocardioides flavescens]|uniref:Alpha/beta hydrolase n=1 Tax=Nocardioides flavescens TaxID=2691959 RepID=A0A6L7EZP8_9ACTN|nr:hypothetical protein [Nocardioides flavescens]MXG89132.1 hypothetical protein [Nocardioides flavescens]
MSRPGLEGPASDAVLLGVSGGAGGVAAVWEQVLTLAAWLDAAGDRVRERAGETAATAHDADLLESSVLSPATCAAAEAAVLTAAAATTAAALSAEADAVAVRVAVAALRAADATSGAAVSSLRGHLALWPTTALPLLLATPADERAGLLQDAVGVLSSTALLHPALLARLYGAPRRPRVTSYDAPAGRAPRRDRPRSVRDLVTHLRQVAALSPDPHSEGNGTIEVQTLRLPDGSVRHVVYLPGTDRFDAPWDQDGDVRAMGTNLELVARGPDAYTRGVLEAMREAGVGSEEPVLVVGHSQGGMAAAALAAGGTGFAITAAVTAGAPTAQVSSYPKGTHVLSLEQHGDVVPLLDGRDNPDSVEQTTVTFDAHPPEGVVAHHDYDTYAEGAGLVDASSDPSVTEAVTSLEDAGFLGEGDDTVVESRLFQITR